METFRPPYKLYIIALKLLFAATCINSSAQLLTLLSIIYGGGWHSTEVALALPIQLSRVQI